MKYTHASLKINKAAFYVILSVFVVNTIVLVNYNTYVNIRYRLPVMALFLIVAFYSFLIILQQKPRLRQGILSLLLVVTLMQNWATIDFASRNLMQVWQFGQHDLLCMTSKVVSSSTCGRDEKRYNLQYTEIIFLLNQAIKTMNLIYPPHFITDSAENFFLFSNIDLHTQKMTIRPVGDGVVAPVLYSFNAPNNYSESINLMTLADENLPETMYYFILPMQSDKSHFLVERGYKVHKQDINHQGYTIQLVTAQR